MDVLKGILKMVKSLSRCVCYFLRKGMELHDWMQMCAPGENLFLRIGSIFDTNFSDLEQKVFSPPLNLFSHPITSSPP